MFRLPPTSTLFPYTTLFRSQPLGQWTMILHAPGLARIRMTLGRSEEHTSELQSRGHLVCRLLLEKKNKRTNNHVIKTIFNLRKQLFDTYNIYNDCNQHRTHI